MSDLLRHGCGCRLQKLCRLRKLCFLFPVITEDSLPGQRLDSAHAGRNSGLGYDLERRDHPGVRHMSAAAQFFGEMSHGYHADILGILLVKQCHGAALLRFLQIHDLRHDRKRRADLFVDDVFHPAQFFRRHLLEMREIKAETIRRYQRTLLLHVVAQHQLERFLKQMGRAVVLTGVCASGRVRRQSHPVARPDEPGRHMAHMPHFTPQ